MEYIYTFIFDILILTTNAYQLAPYIDTGCPKIFHLEHKTQTFFLDLAENSSVHIKTCILKNMALEQSILLIRGYNTNNNNLLKRFKSTDHPNIIIITEEITPFMLYSPSVKRVFASHRSFVLIIITDETKFKCSDDDGTMGINDFISLETFMNELWHEYRMMNVVLSFPLSCKGKLAIYSGKRISNHTFYDRTIKLIDFKTNHLKDVIKKGMTSLTEDYPLRGHIFLRYPTSITDCEKMHYYTKTDLNMTQGFCGLDAFVMGDVIKHFKFNLYFPKNDETCSKYGYGTPNNITGSLGCIVRKELDISFNSRFMTMYSTEYVYFIHYVVVDSLCVLVKRPEIIPLWHYAISVYEDKLWLLIISLISLIGIIMWIMTILKHKVNGVDRNSLLSSIREVFVLTMFGYSLKKKETWYLFKGTCLCYSIMFMAIYQGHINRVFTALQRYQIIKTLDSLYSSDKVLYLSHAMKEIMKQLHKPEYKAQDDFLRRAHVIKDNYLPGFILQHPQSALLGRKNDLKLEILSGYTDEHGQPLINIVDECFYTYYLSYIARAGFPFLEEMQRFMEHITEAGLPIIYYRWTYNMLRVPQSFPTYRNEPRPFAKINIDNCRIAFAVLSVGYFVSSIVFIIELRRGKHNISK